jgi:hypothetical protein
MNSIIINEKIISLARLEGFSGHDPFDGLNSEFFKIFPKSKKSIIGLVWIQLFKRSPINFRSLFLIAKKRNPKGIGLFILGLIEDYQRTKNKDYLDQAIELADWLLTQSCDLTEWQHSCWGYHFDWNARAFFVPKNKPNVITTIYVAQALYALGEVTGEQRFTISALDAAHFIVKTLYCEDDGRKFFAYIPGENAFVHNASLWGAAWVGFVANVTDNEQYKQLAFTVAQQSIQEQRSDGSWVYGSRHHHQFIDGFHTGYNLEALDVLRSALQTTEFDYAIDKGLAFYKLHLFEQDGTAKYYNDNRYPLDMHCVSQAILTLLKVGGTAECIALVDKIINKAIATLYCPKSGHFVYQKHKHFTNKINYIRWTQSWVYYSFAYFNHFADKQVKLAESKGKKIK